MSYPLSDGGLGASKCRGHTGCREVHSRQRGRLFVWIDEHDLEHWKCQAPDHPVDFEEVPCGGFDFSVDRSILEPAAKWYVSLLHVPYRHLEVSRGRGRFRFPYLPPG